MIDYPRRVNSPVPPPPDTDAGSLGRDEGDRPPAAADAEPGREESLPSIGFIGRYALKYQIGKGGLGTVYAAYDPLLSRVIAIKTLHLEIEPEQRESFNALFLNEARAAAGLSHRNIVTVFDAGIDAHKFCARDRNGADGLALQLTGGDQLVDASLIAREQRAVGFGELVLLPAMRYALLDETPVDQ